MQKMQAKMQLKKKQTKMQKNMRQKMQILELCMFCIFGRVQKFNKLQKNWRKMQKNATSGTVHVLQKTTFQFSRSYIFMFLLFWLYFFCIFLGHGFWVALSGCIVLHVFFCILIKFYNL